MAAVGNQTSLRKKSLTTQAAPAVAYTSIVFQHKATVGDTGISLSNLVTPSEATSNGFVQPSVARIAAAEIKRYPSSFMLVSSIGGVLQPGISYVISGNLQIRFVGFTALADEIFTGYITSTPVTGAVIADTTAYGKTGVLAAGQTDINVGDQFRVNYNSSQQVGQYQLEIDGVGQFRNTGNSSTTLDGNYYEVDSGDGTGTIIRLNVAPTEDVSYKLVPIGAVVERPAGSMMQVVEQQAGVIAKLVEVVAEATGLDEDDLTAAPTYPDLKAFGDRVLDTEADIVTLSETGSPGTPKNATTSTPGAVKKSRYQIKGLTTNTAVAVSPSTTTLFTFNGLTVGNWYKLSAHMMWQLAGAAVSGWIDIPNLANAVFGGASTTLRSQSQHAVGQEPQNSASFIFQATTTSITILGSSNAATATALGNTGAFARSFAMLEELGDIEVTTAFT